MNKQEMIDLFEILKKIEIKGDSNVFFMYKIMAFLQQKIAEADEKKET